MSSDLEPVLAANLPLVLEAVVYPGLAGVGRVLRLFVDDVLFDSLASPAVAATQPVDQDTRLAARRGEGRLWLALSDAVLVQHIRQIGTWQD